MASEGTSSILSKLELDYWYKVVIVVSAAILLLTGTGLLSAFPVVPTALVSLGTLFVGIGEWINHPLQTAILPRSYLYGQGIVTSHNRRPNLLGSCFDLLGALLIGIGIYKYFS